MNREIKGQIHKVSKDFKIISVQVVRKLEFFYLQPRFVKQFRKYLYPGVFVQFTTNADKSKMRRRVVSTIISFDKIIGNRYHRKFAYYDQKIVKNNIIEKIEQYDFRLFLDLEMTMQRSRHGNEEIIQAGAYLVNKFDKEILTFNEFIQPSAIDTISKRTFKFLNIKEEKINKGINYQNFYHYFQKIMEKYHPAVIVWGNNDIYALDKSYLINNVTPLFNSKNFINLQQIHKDFFKLNNEIGLFKTAKIYKINCGEQTHDALIDAYITRLIFNEFYNIACKDIDFDFKQEMIITKMI